MSSFKWIILYPYDEKDVNIQIRKNTGDKPGGLAGQKENQCVCRSVVKKNSKWYSISQMSQFRCDTPICYFID